MQGLPTAFHINTPRLQHLRRFIIFSSITVAQITMANVVSLSQPRAIPGAGLASTSPDNNMVLPHTPIHRLKSTNLTLDTMSPVTQNGSFAFDRVIKSGQVLKRTRKTKVR